MRFCLGGRKLGKVWQIDVLIYFPLLVTGGFTVNIR